MDAQVQALTARISTLQAQLGVLIQKYAALQIAPAAMPPAEEAAVVAANAVLATLSGQVSNALVPPVTP